MKRIALVFFLSIFFSRVVFAQIQFGITTGVELSKFAVNYPIDYERGLSDYQPKIGYKVALIVECALVPDALYLSSELAFTQRGTKQTQTDTIRTISQDIINYLWLPVNLAYKFNLTEDTKMSVFAGPYVGYALSGWLKGKDTLLEGPNAGRTETWSNGTGFGYNEGKYKPIDLGFNFGVGLEYFDYFIKVQYNHGLTNLLNGTSNFHKNRNIGISLGYLF